MDGWSRHGIPEMFSSDRWTQFDSQVKYVEENCPRIKYVEENCPRIKYVEENCPRINYVDEN